MFYKDEFQEEIDVVEKIKKLKSLKLKDKEISSILSELYDVNKKQVYQKCLDLK